MKAAAGLSGSPLTTGLQRLLLTAVASLPITLATQRSTAQEEEGDDPVINSIVQLRDFPALLDEAALSNHIGEAFGLEAGDQPGKGRYFVSGTEEVFVAAIDGVFFSILEFSEPYFLDPEAEGQRYRDPRLREAIRRNNAWLSVDLIHNQDDPGAVTAAYRTMGRLQASLVSENTLALYDPRAQVAVDWHPQYAALLQSATPLVVFAAGLLDFEAGPEVLKDWIAFLAAYAGAEDKSRFYLQAKIADAPDKAPELRWLRILRLGAGSFDVASLIEPVDWADPKAEGNSKLEQGSVTAWKILEQDGATKPADPPPKED